MRKLLIVFTLILMLAFLVVMAAEAKTVPTCPKLRSCVTLTPSATSTPTPTPTAVTADYSAHEPVAPQPTAEMSTPTDEFVRPTPQPTTELSCAIGLSMPPVMICTTPEGN